MDASSSTFWNQTDSKQDEDKRHNYDKISF
jgi:hypothetical protein